MKKLKTITICLVIAYIVVQYAAGASYYKLLFTEDLIGNYGELINVFLILLKGMLNIAIVVTGILALASAGEYIRERSYSLFRYMYVMAYLVGFPLTVFSLSMNAKYFFADAKSGLMIIVQHLISITFIVLLLICKAQRPVPGVNLRDYDMVSFTTAGHRFVHYLLDSLFLAPVFMSMGTMIYSMARIYNQDSIPIMICFLAFLNFFLYFFLSEAIFRQTFGKMITRSCVATNGIEFSNGRMFLRTFCRLIPFDRFSFLFGANWHDKVSATAVVYVDSWEKAFDDKPNSEQA
jgi:hypothetical protein